MQTYSNTVSLSAKLFTAVLMFLLFRPFSSLAQPVDNPVESRYPGQYPFASALSWSRVFDITQYGAVGDSTTDNATAFAQACQAAFSAGGGVVYFPAGVYYFSTNITLKAGVVLRGETPTLLNAMDANYRLASRLVFPKYEPSFIGNGTPDSTAFKGIYSENPNSDSNIGLVYLDVNRGTIYLATRFGNKEYINAQNNYIATNQNVVILGIKSNNAAVTGSSRATIPGLGSGVPAGLQNRWQRWPNRFIGNINIEVAANCLVASCRINDRPSDDFLQPGYLYRDGTPILNANTTWFRYTDKSAIFVNSQMPDISYWAADSAKAPWWFRPGVTIRDNWIYRTKRDGIQASGNGLLILNNVVKDTANKPCSLNPTGLTPAQGFDYNGNRSIWIRGGNNVVVEGNHVVGHQQTIGQYASNDGEGIVADNQGSLLNGLLIRNNDITCNWAGLYDVPLLKNILFVGNHIRRNNVNSNQDLLLYSKLGGYEGRNTCQTCIMDSNMIYAPAPGGEIYWTIEAGSQYWITRNQYLTNAGTTSSGGRITVESRSLGSPYNLDTATVYEGCNSGFSRVASPVRWVNPASCLDAPVDSITTRIVTSLIPVSFASSTLAWTVYPNPTNDYIYLGFATTHAGWHQIQITGSTGQVQSAWSYSAVDKQVNVSQLTPGVYIISGLDRAGKIVRGRFVKR